MERKIRQMTGMPVISLESGAVLGKVKGAVVSPDERRITALVLEGKGLAKDQRVIPFERIRSVGEHAVTVERGGSVERAANLPAIARLMKDAPALLGAQVITEEGNLLGTVEGYSFNPSNGQIVSLELGGKGLASMFKGQAILAAEQVVTVGKSTVVARVNSEEQMVRVEGAIQETFKTVKDASSRVWDSTRRTTKKLGDSLSKSLGKLTAEEGDPEGPPNGGNGQQQKSTAPKPEVASTRTGPAGEGAPAEGEGKPA